MIFDGKKAPVIVIGMHRSGTSMFTRVLMDAGIFMGVDLSTNSESYFFTACNEELLKQEDASWHKPKLISRAELDFDQNKFWVDFLRVRSRPWNALKLTKKHVWGWKDPRNTFTLPFWISQHFPQAKVVHIYRNGIEVAQSLQRRNQLLEEGVKVPDHDEFSSCFRLWESYVDQAFSYRENSSLPQFHISYEELTSINSSKLTELSEFLGIRDLTTSLRGIVNKGKPRNQAELTAADAELVQNSEWMKKLNYL